MNEISNSMTKPSPCKTPYGIPFWRVLGNYVLGLQKENKNGVPYNSDIPIPMQDLAIDN